MMLKGLQRLSPEDHLSLTHQLKNRDVIWILGNHDPLPQGVLPGADNP